MKEELLAALMEIEIKASPELEARFELFYGNMTVEEKKDEALKILKETLPLIFFLLKAL